MASSSPLNEPDISEFFPISGDVLPLKRKVAHLRWQSVTELSFEQLRIFSQQNVMEYSMNSSKVNLKTLFKVYPMNKVYTQYMEEFLSRQPLQYLYQASEDSFSVFSQLCMDDVWFFHFEGKGVVQLDRNVASKYGQLPSSRVRSDVIFGFKENSNTSVDIPRCGRVIFPYFFCEIKPKTDAAAFVQLNRYMIFGVDGLATLFGLQAKCYGATLCGSQLELFQMELNPDDPQKYISKQLAALNVSTIEGMMKAATFVYNMLLEAENHLWPQIEKHRSGPRRSFELSEQWQRVEKKKEGKKKGMTIQEILISIVTTQTEIQTLKRRKSHL